MEFLPLNTTTILQPKHQGVIRNLKLLYRPPMLSRMVLCSDLRSAVGMLADSWKAVTQETLCNCFCPVGSTLGTKTAISPGENDSNL
ncbi:hypothetical protein HPB49_002085 [Dermacentor silvarum]|uniref:Uncharacterized protein n=1 Tax=Dermacentor silvarum TaxID=543639 RepID=A0ACB8C1C3_DERSI|nr:hypothetical protein HPB49_002085 [Dermacentor silvarum]